MSKIQKARESIRNKINRKNNNIFLGGWKARGIPKGGFERVLARKAKKGKKFWSAGWKPRLKEKEKRNKISHFFDGSYLHTP